MAAASLALQSLIPGSAARQRSYVSTQLSGRGQTPALCRKYVQPEAALLLNFRRPALLCDRALPGGCCMLAGRHAYNRPAGLSRMLSGRSLVLLSVAPVSSKGCISLGLLLVLLGVSRAWVRVQSACL